MNSPVETGTAKIVENYDLYREGDFEPHLGKTITVLIFKTTDFIVYLDEDLFVEWAFTPSYGDWSLDISRVLNRVTQVQAFPLSHLSQDQLSTFRQLVGEAVARLLKDRQPGPANEALDAAVRWVEGRNREIARWWYLKASISTTVAAALTTLALWLLREPVRTLVGDNAFDVALGGGAGAIGALLFVLARSKGFRFDPSAAKRIHQFEGVSRILAGGVGAVLVALGIQGGILLSTTASTGNRLAALLAACMVAGASERLVPSLIERVNDAGLKEPGTENSVRQRTRNDELVD